jgi:predicted metal-dependent phosphoesterase TrpH
MRFDLHIHSSCSDGHDDIKTIIKYAAKKGLDGIAITDHDTMRGSAVARGVIKDLKLEMILLPGAEVTTAQGHLLVLGVSDLPSRMLSPEETTEIAHDLGGISIVPHPYHPFRHAIGRIPKCDGVEVYNSKHLFGIANARARMDARRHHLPMVAGSDSHYAKTVGLGVTKIDADSADDAIRAIGSGRTIIDGKRTPPKYFIGNTFKAIYLDVRNGVRYGKRY